LRLREYGKAAEAFLHAAQSTKNWAAYMARARRRDNVENTESRLVGILNDLANTYRVAGRLEDAREQYQEALSYINNGGTRSSSEASLYGGLGEIDLQQKRFPQALENFRRAHVIAEQQQSSALISSTNGRMGDLYRMTDRPSEAIPYYQVAIQQTEGRRGRCSNPKNIGNPFLREGWALIPT
jgi:tetratricopeptide (TPR) repeat protein